MNPPKRRHRAHRGAYLSREWGHFVLRGAAKHRHRRYRRNPAAGKSHMGTYLMLGGAAYLFMTSGGRALLSNITGGLGLGVGGATVAADQSNIPSNLPAGSVRLSNGTYRTPTGQIYAAPPAGSNQVNLAAPIVTAAVQTGTGWLVNWIKNLGSTSSAGGGATVTPGTGDTSTVSGTVAGDPLGTGASTTTAPDILSGSGSALPDLPPLGETTVGAGGTDFWSGINTTALWGNMATADAVAAGDQAALTTGPVPVLELTLSSPALPDLPPLPDYTQPADVASLMGLGRFRLPARYN